MKQLEFKFTTESPTYENLTLAEFIKMSQQRAIENMREGLYRAMWMLDEQAIPRTVA